MPNPWNFGDTLADAIQANRNRAHETNLTLYQLAQQQRQMNALRDFQRQQLDLQGEQIGIDRAREARLAAEAQRNYELNFIDPDGEGPMGQVSRYQYEVNRDFEERNRMVPTGDKASYFGGRTEVPASEYTETLGAVGQMYVIDQAGRNALAALKAQAMQGGTLPRPYQNTTPEQRAALRALYQNQADQYRQQQNYEAAAEIDAIILGLQSEDVFSGTASGGGAPAPMLSEEDRAFLGQMSPAVHADDLLGEINKWDAVAQSDAYSAAERQAARERADSFRAERARILAQQSGEITPVMDAYNSLGNQLPVFRGALEGALSASGSVQGNPAIMALVARARALRALREQQRTP